MLDGQEEVRVQQHEERGREDDGELDLGAEFLRDFFPSRPVVLGKAVLEKADLVENSEPRASSSLGTDIV